MNLDRFPLGRPNLSLLPGEEKYPFVLEQDFIYLWPGKGKWKAMDICVPKGYKTDLLSIPKPLWPILSPFGAGAWGGLPHDLGYSTHFGPRDMIDQVLYDAARDSGASRIRALTLYTGVRAGGSFVWNDNDPAEVSDDLQAMVEATERWQNANIAVL